jgi:stage V sporulation protein G
LTVESSAGYNKAARGGFYDMEITDIRIRKVEAEGKMKAVVSVTFDNEFVVHDIKIIESQGGLFIAMPSRKTPTGEFRDIAHPINADSRNKVQSAILVKYQTLMAEEESVETVIGT